mmetsp:Transcript_4272/g.8911  ORF Transcript_4272/g.8911 Transcript_4272/m.8911 type:complete len:228 (-) Transcript_4272:366-1049(-)
MVVLKQNFFCGAPHIEQPRKKKFRRREDEEPRERCCHYFTGMCTATVICCYYTPEKGNSPHEGHVTADHVTNPIHAVLRKRQEAKIAQDHIRKDHKQGQNSAKHPHFVQYAAPATARESAEERIEQQHEHEPRITTGVGRNGGEILMPQDRRCDDDIDRVEGGKEGHLRAALFVRRPRRLGTSPTEVVGKGRRGGYGGGSPSPASSARRPSLRARFRRSRGGPPVLL